MISRFINTVAMLAMLLVLISGLWQGWGLLPTLKRMIISYLAFFCLGSILALMIRSVPYLEGSQTGEQEDTAPKS